MYLHSGPLGHPHQPPMESKGKARSITIKRERKNRKGRENFSQVELYGPSHPNIHRLLLLLDEDAFDAFTEGAESLVDFGDGAEGDGLVDSLGDGLIDSLGLVVFVGELSVFPHDPLVLMLPESPDGGAISVSLRLVTTDCTRENNLPGDHAYSGDTESDRSDSEGESAVDRHLHRPPRCDPALSFSPPLPLVNPHPLGQPFLRSFKFLLVPFLFLGLALVPSYLLLVQRLVQPLDPRVDFVKLLLPVGDFGVVLRHESEFVEKLVTLFDEGLAVHAFRMLGGSSSLSPFSEDFIYVSVVEGVGHIAGGEGGE